jgi:hypothetical protein
MLMQDSLFVEKESTMTLDIQFIEEEQRRIEPQICEGDMQAEVKSDMGKWAKASGRGWSRHHSHIVDAYAEARGWTQEGFTGMEIDG